MTMKTEITVDTHRTLTSQGRSLYGLALCGGCGEQVQMVTVDEAVILARRGSRAIYRLIEVRRLHFTETADRMVLICLNSLENLS